MKIIKEIFCTIIGSILVASPVALIMLILEFKDNKLVYFTSIILLLGILFFMAKSFAIEIENAKKPE